MVIYEFIRVILVSLFFGVLAAKAAGWLWDKWHGQ